jgi:hypothetical protein
VIDEHALLEALDLGEPVAVDFLETTEIAGERVRLALNRVAAEVLEEIVVCVDSIEGRVGGMRLVQIAEQIVDEMRKGLGSNHRIQRL